MKAKERKEKLIYDVKTIINLVIMALLLVHVHMTYKQNKLLAKQNTEFVRAFASLLEEYTCTRKGYIMVDEARLVVSDSVVVKFIDNDINLSN